MADRGNFEHDYWRSVPNLSGDWPALAPGTIQDAEFRLLADNIPTPCWIANGDGFIVWFNRRWHEYTGTTREQMEGWGWQSVHDPEVLPTVMERWTSSIATGEPFEMTFPLKGRDGVFRPFLTRVQPVRDKSGALVRWFGVNTEISALRQSEVRYRQVFENAAVGMIEIDASWNILKSNDVYRDITGRTEEELQGANCLSFTHPDDVSTGEDALRSLAARKSGRVAFEKRYVRPSGDVVWVRSSLSRVSGDDTANRFLKVVEDITEIRLAREALRQESEALEVLNRTAAQVAAELDLANVVQLVTDAGVKLTGARFGAFFYNTVNEAGESLMLYTLSGADRADFERFGHPRATPVFAPTFKGEGVVRSDDITADPRYGKNAPNRGMPEGHLPVRSYLAVPVTSRSGEVIGGLFFGHPDSGVFTEASERLMLGLAGQAAIAIDNARLFEAAQRANQALEQRVEERTQELQDAHEALRQSQKMETVGQLTGGIAHDFNNLLQIVSGNLDLLRQKIPDDAEHLKRYADRAFNGSERAATLTQRLLAFSRRQPLAPKPVDINRLIPGMSELLHRTLGETIEVESVLAPRLWTVEADPNQLENAIINLAINARDAMPEGGKLTIETQNTHLDHSYAAQNPEVAVGQYAVICISDTGTGMDAETAAKAVEPFFTTKEVGRGTGLGLSMVYGFVKQSGGHIKLYSELGEGTTVKMYLPRLLGRFEQTAEPALGAIKAQGEESILVCEDDEDVRAYSAEVLRELGYRVLEAVDGPSALALLKAHGDVDLLFTDVVLPGGMTGAVLAREAAKLQPNIKTLFTTGYARNAIVHHGRLDPGVELITKPFSYADLAARVRDILDRASEGP
jgi:PAS domain S-box-containing protein